MYHIDDDAHPGNSQYIIPPIIVNSNNPPEVAWYDKDGYYNWGIGTRPPDCPDTELDSDDSEPRIGPFDDNYFGTLVAPDMVLSYENEIINEDDFLTFVEDDPIRIFTITIKNIGNAQLNFYNELTSPPDDLIESSNPDIFEIDLNNLPTPNIEKIDGETSFQIIYHNTNGTGHDQAIITIHTMEPEYENYEFVIANFECPIEPGDDIIITGQETWNTSGIIIGNVNIQRDAELIIEGNYGFIEGVDLVIEQGGSLIIDGGLLTNACGDIWQGIDVWGNSKKSQYIVGNQGYVNIKNEGSIRNSIVAIEAAQMLTGGYNSSTTGGVIKCNTAVFIDNISDIIIYPYENFHPITEEEASNVCSFKNTQFINASLCFPGARANLWGVEGVTFTGSTFVNKVVSSDCMLGDYKKGIGIKSFNSGFYVDDYCVNYTIPCNETKQCYFENLEYGIYAFNGELSKYISIDTAIFKNNSTGIYMSWVDNQSVIRNKFIFDDAHDLTGEVAGLYLEYGTSFSIEENIFSSDVQDITVMGIQLFNTGSLYNEIYNNTFRDLNTGISAAGINRDTDGNGLCIKCNDFKYCVTDVHVHPGGMPNGTTIGIAVDQGTKNESGGDDAALAAGNTFTKNNTESNYDINENCTSVFYTHQKYNLTDPTKIIPTLITNKVELIEDEDAQYSKETSCPSNLNGSQIDELVEKGILASEFIEISAYNDTLSLLTDGGDTDALNTDIQFSLPNEAMELRQQLMDESPYLSDTAMKSAIDKENVLPNAMIRDILVANPQSSKTPDVIQSIDNRFDPMPGYMMAEIMAGQDIVGAKEILEQKLSFHKAKRDRSFTKLERYYLGDTSNVSSANDSLISLWSGEPYPLAKYNLSFQYIISGDSLSTFNNLDNIPLEFDLEAKEENTHHDYEILFNVLEQLHCDSILLDSNMTQSLLSIYTKKTRPGVCARNILVNDSIVTYAEFLYFPDLLKSNQVLDFKTPVIDKESLMKVFPNPAGNYFIVEYDLSGFVGSSYILVTDMNGKHLKSYNLKDKHNQLIISTSGLRNGTYIIHLYLNNNFKEAVKIIVVK